VPEEPLAPVTPVAELLPGPPLLVLPVAPVLPPLLLPVLPDPELPLVPLLLDPLPCCCRHFVRSAPVRPVHWLDEVVLPPALPPLPDVPLLLPELMPEPLLPEAPVLLPEAPVLLPELTPDPLLPLLVPPLVPLLDCAHDTAATPTSAAVTAAPITVFTMIRFLSRLK
jgi:hypothetical protein